MIQNRRRELPEMDYWPNVESAMQAGCFQGVPVLKAAYVIFTAAAA